MATVADGAWRPCSKLYKFTANISFSFNIEFVDWIMLRIFSNNQSCYYRMLPLLVPYLMWLQMASNIPWAVLTCRASNTWRVNLEIKLIHSIDKHSNSNVITRNKRRFNWCLVSLRVSCHLYFDTLIWFERREFEWIGELRRESLIASGVRQETDKKNQRRAFLLTPQKIKIIFYLSWLVRKKEWKKEGNASTQSVRHLVQYLLLIKPLPARSPTRDIVSNSLPSSECWKERAIKVPPVCLFAFLPHYKDSN